MDRITTKKPTTKKTSRPELPWKLIYILRGVAVTVAAVLVLVFWLISRVDRSEITTEVIPQPVESRMLAAILPHRDQAWFFKMLGPQEAVAEQRGKFNDYIQSIRFDAESSQPEWDLPAGWRQLPDDAPPNQGTIRRFATLQAAVAGQNLELSVTSLPFDSQGGDAYLLANINRWRKQLELGELTLNQLSSRTNQIDVNGVTATLVEIAGKQPTESQVNPPFAGESATAQAAAPARRPPTQPTFEAPEKWTSGGATSMSLASYQVQEDDRQVRITVTPLPPSDLLANVNRWRSQISLEQIKREELGQVVSKIQLGDIDGDYVALESPDQTILGVIAVHDDLAWFIKLIGDTSLAQRERGRFEEFVRSFRFN